jgi:glycosyltransferase involved in cell wall biosynthesis
VGLDEGWDRIVQMDADFSHDPKDVPRLLAALDAGADLAIGSRYVEGGGTENWGLGRRVISRGGGLYARTALGVGINDLTAGFKAWKAPDPAGDRPRRGRRPRLRLPDRDDLPDPAERLSASRRSPSCSSIAGGQLEDVGAIFFEAVTLVWRIRFAIGKGRG